VEELITGPGSTRLSPREILASVLIPLREPHIRLWRKVGTRRANALTKVSIAAFADLRDGHLVRTRICLGAVAPTVVRVRTAESWMDGRTPADLRRGEAELRQAAREAVRPIDDQRSTAGYRRRVAENLVWYFVRQILTGGETTGSEEGEP
jgi:CO/xanthine dehydrogenase FAD-binding subunit